MIKRLFTLACLLLVSASIFAARPTRTISGEITTNTTWYKDTIYVLSGYVYVKENSGATLTIQPGTIIKGDKSTKGTLIVERGTKLMAEGTAENPIVFTSNQSVGNRSTGDWGGVILCGKAHVNAPGGDAQIEGGPRTHYGGTDDNDNSGSLKYVRIEYAGIALSPNNEINGLTFGGVGAGTTIDYIQVSWSGDDSYEWFGGTVNCKHLIAIGGVDDDFDTDFGYSGKVQFALGLRDSATADVSGSHAFESDGYKDDYNTNKPNTRCIFSNTTVFGPIFENGNAGKVDPLFVGALLARRNTRIGIVNSVIGGYPWGYGIAQLQDDSVLAGYSSVAGTSTTDDLLYQNNILVGNADTFVSESYAGGNGAKGASRAHMRNWVTSSSRSNTIMPLGSSSSKFFATELGTTNPWGLDFTQSADIAISNYYVMPKSGSTLLSGASFTNTRLQDNFFDKVSYRGAFGSNDWTQGWTAWDPQNMSYTTTATSVEDAAHSNIQVRMYPNPANESINFRLILDKSELVNIEIYDMSGRKLMNLAQEKLSSGPQQLSYSTEGLGNGVYIVKLTTGSSSQAMQLIISGK